MAWEERSPDKYGAGHPSRVYNRAIVMEQGGSVEILISLAGEDQVAGLESLGDWLRGEPELAGRVRVNGSAPREGELGALAEVLVVAVGSGGTLSVLAASLKSWISQPRRSDFQIRVKRPDGHSIEITANRANSEQVDTLLRQALSDQVPKE